MTLEPRPLQLHDNRVPLYYRGGERISRFRDTELQAGPEDWVGSTCVLPKSMIPADFPSTTGISPTSQGLLTEVIAAAPEQWLGADLHQRYGGNPGLLVKLLDAGERLPVHCHPDRAFARVHLGSCFGKTEGWIVMVAEDRASVWLGMRETTPYETFMKWIERGDTSAMLDAMNELPARAGDVFYIPAGLPHAIGEGILVTELQEPVTLSVSANHLEFGLDEMDATMGLGWSTAIHTFDLTAKDPHADGLIARPTRSTGHTGMVNTVFSAAAAPFFQALTVDTADGSATLAHSSFCIVVVNAGAGCIGGPAYPMVDVKTGQTWVLPFSSGPLTFAGDLRALVCLPPDTRQAGVTP